MLFRIAKVQEYMNKLKVLLKYKRSIELELNKFNEWTKLKNEYKKSVSNYETIITI